MLRIFGRQFSKVNQFSSLRCEIVRKICTTCSVQQRKTKAEEIAEKKRKDDIEKAMGWSKFYQFTDMKYHAIVTRLKIYPVLATIIGTPIAYMVEVAEVIPFFSIAPVLAFGLTGTITLSMYSAALSNTIGLIYICKDYTNIRIGYIDFMGRQHFIETTIQEMIKWEKSPLKFGYYKTVKAMDNNTEKLLKIPWKNVDIYDIKLYRRCFGK